MIGSFPDLIRNKIESYVFTFPFSFNNTDFDLKTLQLIYDISTSHLFSKITFTLLQDKKIIKNTLNVSDLDFEYKHYRYAQDHIAIEEKKHQGFLALIRETTHNYPSYIQQSVLIYPPRCLETTFLTLYFHN